mmetsp:Transcript_17905/g.42110  ORF Transcript_17905/g.42110 Transcript_17905/m.42110 type:complete len:126 (+) Transcript_17905:197-574(+)
MSSSTPWVALHSSAGSEASLELTVQLGDVLCSGDFWQEAAKSASTMDYLEVLLGPAALGDAARHTWLRRLPVHLQGETLALEDFSSTTRSTVSLAITYPVSKELLPTLGLRCSSASASFGVRSRH